MLPAVSEVRLAASTTSAAVPATGSTAWPGDRPEVMPESEQTRLELEAAELADRAWRERSAALEKRAAELRLQLRQSKVSASHHAEEISPSKAQLPSNAAVLFDRDAALKQDDSVGDLLSMLPSPEKVRGVI
eukprot:TRINITY_DN28137_c0_g1_i1.p1 TRINITY_DN28137_c0_g1~~TRINITY_DN28137_c0_g1_i1.p1  ORF type:complete len:132 (-),score=39.58 TRINITY_DN28137_c0_g1_i1:151-546(-)